MADLPGVGWRILDGASWRRHHPCLSIGFFHHHKVYAQMHQKRRGQLVIVLTLLFNYYDQLANLFIDIWQNLHGGERMSMHYNVTIGRMMNVSGGRLLLFVKQLTDGPNITFSILYMALNNYLYYISA